MEPMLKAKYSKIGFMCDALRLEAARTLKREVRVAPRWDDVGLIVSWTEGEEEPQAMEECVGVVQNGGVVDWNVDALRTATGATPETMGARSVAGRR